MNTNISKLTVSRFRFFGDLKVDGFGRVNLTTGRNNAGKSTLLEAIRLLATEGSPATFFSILNYREETDPRAEDPGAAIMPGDFSAFCNLFCGFPSLAECREPFSISGENGTPQKLSARVAWFTEESDAEQGRRIIPAPNDLFGESSGFPALEVELANRRRIIRLDRPLRYRRIMGDAGEGISKPCVFLDPFSSRSTSQLAAFWDAIALTEAEGEVVRALQIVSKDIQAVSMVGNNDAVQRSRTAIAKCLGCSHPVPLRSFGDGVNRLFGLILSLTCAKSGVLLVDEIENGLPHSVLVDIWRTLFRLARQLDVQVFATSHSWDCIEAFQKAANEDVENGVLIRLARKGDLVIPTVLRDKELQIVARDRIEVRQTFYGRQTGAFGGRKGRRTCFQGHFRPA
jgi:energy-coupling factor transporter ATP-binding protein EcfA2